MNCVKVQKFAEQHPTSYKHTEPIVPKAENFEKTLNLFSFTLC